MDHQFQPISPMVATTSQSFNPMSVLSMQQLHQQTQTRGSPHILPPLQPQQTSIGLPHQIYGQSGGSPHTPQTPNTPHTPISAGGSGSFSHMAQQHSPYLQSSQPYSSPASLMSPVSVTHPQSMVHSPAHSRQHVPPRPLPSTGLSQMPRSMNSQYGHSRALSQSSITPNQDIQPTHVVGSQGRRGILPSEPGRAVAVAGAGASKNGLIPIKDADGKFPCPHCNKSYLHAKHLKRHLLRHTGDRPYMCVLCKDTFSRSDILKRHFQKCSLRRGNPTGATHLSHTHAYHKKSRSASYKATTPGSDVSPMDDARFTRNGSSRGLATSSPSKYTDEQRVVSASLSGKNSMKRSNSNEENGGSRGLTSHGPSVSHRGSMDIRHNERLATALSVMESSVAAFTTDEPAQPPFPNGFDFSSQGPASASHQGNGPRDHSPLSDMTQGSNRGSLPYFNGPQNQTSEVDWPNMFQTVPHDTLMNPMLQSNMSHGHMPIKSEPPLETGSYEPATDSHDGMFSNLY